MNLFNGLFASGVLNYSETFRWIAYINPLFLVNVPLSLPQVHCFEAGDGASEEERIAAGCPTIPVLRDGQLQIQTSEGFVEDLLDTTYDQRWKYYVAIIGVAVVFQLLAQLLATHVSF